MKIIIFSINEKLHLITVRRLLDSLRLAITYCVCMYKDIDDYL